MTGPSTSTDRNRNQPADDSAFEKLQSLVSTFATPLSEWFEGYAAANPERATFIRNGLAQVFPNAPQDFVGTLRTGLSLLREAWFEEPTHSIVPASIGSKFQICLIPNDGEYACRVLWCDMQNSSGESVVGHGLTLQFGNLLSALQLKGQPVRFERLDAIDGAVPYLSPNQIEERLQPYTARSVVLAIPLDRGGLFNSIGGSEGRTYNIFEVGGASFAERVTNALGYLQKDRSARKQSIVSGEFRLRIADIDLPHQLVPQERKDMYQNMSGKQMGPFVEDLYALLGKSTSWQAFQSIEVPETNGGAAYLLIGKKETSVAHLDIPSIWGDVSYKPSSAVYKHLGNFYPTNDPFLELIEDVENWPALDESLWKLYSPEQQ